MEIFKFLLRENEQTATILLASIVVGLLHAGVVIIVVELAQDARHHELIPPAGILGFFACLAAFVLSMRYLLVKSVSVSEAAITDLYLRLADLIRRTELRELEYAGKARIYASITRDAKVISNASLVAMHTIESVTMGFICLIFLFFIAPLIVLSALFVVAMGIMIFLGTNRLQAAATGQANQEEDHFFWLSDHVLDGFMELKMNRKKALDLYRNYLMPAAEETGDRRIEAAGHQAMNISIHNMLFYSIVAIAIFILPKWGIEENMAIAVAVMSYLWLPTMDVLTAIPYVLTSKLSIQRVQGLESELRQMTAADTTGFCPVSGFSRLQLRQVTFGYTGPKGATLFHLGPLDLEVEAGEVLFIVGGNGSGKSTLLKLITGLYPTSRGEILIDGIPQTPRSGYRELFSTVFSDFHLFERLYGIASIDQDRADQLLSDLDLDSKVRLVDKRFSETRLSTGQRKRLALIAACLEDRPIYVFDEWAADQDPEFRKYFYEQFIGDLKRQGKTVIAVTHDDRYFQYADRIVRMEYGKIVTRQECTGVFIE